MEIFDGQWVYGRVSVESAWCLFFTIVGHQLIRRGIWVVREKWSMIDEGKWVMMCHAMSYNLTSQDDVACHINIHVPCHVSSFHINIHVPCHVSSYHVIPEVVDDRWSSQLN
jgi:hypothetical protein